MLRKVKGALVAMGGPAVTDAKDRLEPEVPDAAPRLNDPLFEFRRIFDVDVPERGRAFGHSL